MIDVGSFLVRDLVLNLIMFMFPILVYFIYQCYREVSGTRYNHLMLDVALVSSMYLCFRFGNVSNNAMGLLFCNLPIVVGYLKRQSSVAVLLSLIVVMYSYLVLNGDVVLLIVKFGLYFLLYVLREKKKMGDNLFILLVGVIQGFFLSFEYFGNVDFYQLGDVVRIMLIVFLFYSLPFVLMFLFSLGERITSLYLSVSELERDKQIRNSLFKITHEVKNPIAVCKGYLDMMDVSNGDQVGRYIPIIRQEIDKSLNIMGDFMEFSKIKVEKEIIDINLLLEDTYMELELLMKGKRVSFECQVGQDEVFVMGDYNRLKQVFVNLVKNSLEALDGDGEIRIVGHTSREWYYVEVIDNGCGMSSEVLGQIKEMFFTTKVKGSGLGVSLSNEIIRALDGSLDYYSKEGKGTKVVVKLPVVVV